MVEYKRMKERYEHNLLVGRNLLVDTDKTIFFTVATRRPTFIALGLSSSALIACLQMYESDFSVFALKLLDKEVNQN
jgi:hypothetical protein